MKRYSAKISKRPCNFRYGVFIFILICSSFLFYSLSLQLMAQIYLHKAQNCIRKEYYGLAIPYLKKAAGYPFAGSEIYRHTGNTCYRLARIAQDKNSRLSYLRQSDAALKKAAERNPLDFRIFSALANTQWALLRLYQNQYPDHTKAPWTPLPWFREAVRLRPKGIQNHFALLRYLAWEGKKDEMKGLVRKLIQNSPPAFHYLKKEEFWSDSLLPYCREGLAAAIEKGTLPRQSHMILSGIMEQDKNRAGAIVHFQKAMEYKNFQNRPADYFRLGHLFFCHGDMAKAEKAYMQGLHMSRNREKDLENLYRFYMRQKNPDFFHAFLQKARKRFRLSFRSAILSARVLRDLEQYETAKEILHQIITERPEAEAFYWLARIAEKEQDWDAMELAIQKATVHDSENRHYHAVFSGVLRRLKKFERAGKEAELSRK